ncbi:MAG: glycosyltransferase, partial [Treponema sp.]|nr:glycosyltransferase [Treponema sp.]
MKLTASVVLFNTPRSQIELLFKSVFDAKCVETFYIIDNSPNDKWRVLETEYANIANSAGTKIRYIHNQNLGYGASHNLAMQEAIEDGSVYHVVLNPDIYFEQQVLSKLLDFMDENPDAAYVLPRVEYP